MKHICLASLRILAFAIAVLGAVPGPADAVVGNTGKVTFEWAAVIQNTDRSAANIAGYVLYIRKQDCSLGSGCAVAPYVEIPLGKVTSYTLTGVTREACAFIHARTTSGDLGVISDEQCLPAEFPTPKPGTLRAGP